MNEVFKSIVTRYSCRSFVDKEISDADLEAIAEAGIQSPSAMNRQGWHICVLKNKALISEIESEGMRVVAGLSDQSAHERIKSRGGKLFYNAQAVMFIAVKDAEKNPYAKIDMGIVAQNIALAATSLGINNCHCGMVAFCFAGSKAEELKNKLSIPDGYECNYGVLLGYGNARGIPHVPDKNKMSFIK